MDRDEDRAVTFSFSLAPVMTAPLGTCSATGNRASTRRLVVAVLASVRVDEEQALVVASLRSVQSHVVAGTCTTSAAALGAPAPMIVSTASIAS